jgi:periplasmic protein TonB
MRNARPWILTASVLLHLMAGAALWTRQVDKWGSPAAASQAQLIAVRLLPNSPATRAATRPAIPTDSTALAAPQPTFLSPDAPRILPPMAVQTSMIAAASSAAEPTPAAPPASASQREAAPVAATAQPLPPTAAASYREVALPPDHRACSERSVSSLYPAMLRQRGIEGQVLLRVQVDENGHASAVQVRQGSGWRLLDEAARLVAMACPFVPARRGDQNLASWVEYPVRFALDPQLQ